MNESVRAVAIKRFISSLSVTGHLAYPSHNLSQSYTIDLAQLRSRSSSIDQAQWVYGVRGLDKLYPAEMIDFKTKRSDRIERKLETPLPIGQRIRGHSPTAGGGTLDQDGTVRGYQDGAMLVRFDHQSYAAPLPPEWTFELLPGEPVSHWQVWQVSQRGERLLKDRFETPLPANYFAKQQERNYHQEASRHDDWIPPPRFEVRAVPLEGNSS